MVVQTSVKRVSARMKYTVVAIAMLVSTSLPVVAVSGTGRVAAVSGVTNVRAGQLVSPGARLTTGRNGQIVLLFANGHRLRVGPNTNMVLMSHQPQKRQTLLTLNKGRVWNAVQPGQKNRVVVRTRHTTATVMGTAFDMQVSDAATETTVFEGRVAVKASEPELPTNIFDVLPELAAAPVEPQNTGLQAPTEIASPVREVQLPLRAVPGPYQVSLEQWLEIIANQQIVMRADGQAEVRLFEPEVLRSADEWYRLNASGTQK